MIQCYKLKGPISYTIRFCERNTHLNSEMHWILRPMCRSGNVVSTVLEHTDAVRVCKLSPERPGLGASLPPSTHDFQKFNANTAASALHHVLSELNFIFPPLRQSEKTPYLATREFPVTSLCRCCGILQSSGVENQFSCLTGSGMKRVGQRGDRGFLQDRKVLEVVLGIPSTRCQLVKCFLSYSGS